MATSTALKLARGNDAAFQAIVDTRRTNRMSQIDSLSPAMRTLVHEYGWTVVKACIDLGIKQPKHVRHLVETVLDEFSPTRGSSASQGIRADYGSRAEVKP